MHVAPDAVASEARHNVEAERLGLALDRAPNVS
jgi:hypothetical protein